MTEQERKLKLFYVRKEIGMTPENQVAVGREARRVVREARYNRIMTCGKA